MTTYYTDSSALVKRYVIETGSTFVQELCDPSSGHVLALAEIGLVEIAATLSVKHRQGLIDGSVRNGMLLDLQRDSQAQYWLIDVDTPIVLHAIELTRRHKLRGYDAVHLACALFLQTTLISSDLPAPVLLSADQDLLIAAQTEGMATENPNTYS